MALSYFIEELLSLQRPGGGRLLHVGISQFIIPLFPPNTTITFSTGPLGTDYAYIGYGASFGPAMVPSAFYGWGQQYGSRQYEGILTGWFTGRELDALIFVTSAEPAVGQVQNRTPLFQYYEYIAFVITIASEADYYLVLEALARLGTSAKSEQLAQEANQLLQTMAGGPATPQPPLGGG